MSKSNTVDAETAQSDSSNRHQWVQHEVQVGLSTPIQLDDLPVAAALLQHDDRFIKVNEAFCQLLGYERAEVLGWSCREIMHPDHHVDYWEKNRRLFAADLSSYSQPYYFYTRVGALIHTQMSASGLLDEHDQVCLKLIVLSPYDTPVSMHKLTNINWLQNQYAQRILKAAIDQGMQGLALNSTSGDFIYANPAFAHMYGYQVNEILGKSWRILYQSEQTAIIEESYLPELMKQGLWSGDLIARKQDGSCFDVETSLTLLRDVHGEVAGFVCACRDISERKQAQIALENREQAIRRLYEITSDPELSFQQRVAALLHLGCQQFGFATGVLARVSNGLFNIESVHGETQFIYTGAQFPAAETLFQLVVGSADLVILDVVTETDLQHAPVVAKAGIKAYYGTSLRVINTLHGALCFIDYQTHQAGQLSSADNDFLKLMARWLESELERLDNEQELRLTQRVFNLLPDLIAVIGPDYRYRRVNPMLANDAGLAVEQMIGKSISDLLDENTFTEVFKPHFERCLAGEEVAYESWAFFRHGEPRYLAVACSPLRSREDPTVIEAAVVITRDLTARKQLEEAVDRGEQRLNRLLEERNQMSRDLHDHTLQSLYAVGLFMQGAKEPFRNQALDQGMALLEQGINQVNSAIQELRQSIEGYPKQAECDVDFAVELHELVEAMRFPLGIDFTVQVDRVVAQQLSKDQTLHLLSIAREAMSNCLRHSRAKHGWIVLQKNNALVQFEIGDDGIGFAIANSSTTGNGLNNMRARAHSLGASCEVLTQVGQGVRVIFSLGPAQRTGVKRC